MILSLFFALLLAAFALTDVPNYYPSYLKAKEESARSHKNLLVFVSESQCEKCDAAWNAYSKDGSAVNRYISTQIVINDFDGGVIADLLEVRNTPAFVILDAQGKVIEKWEGGWKDASGNPTLFVQPANASPNTASVTTPNPNIPPSSTTKSTGSNNISTPAVKNNTPSTPPTVSQPELSKKESPATTPSVQHTSSTSVSGYVLQAGYFGSETNAQKCVLDLKTKGAGSFIIKPTQQNGSAFYRVISASFPTEAEAQKQLEKVSTLGVKATLKKASEL